MSILQDPLAALRQAEWYLDNSALEVFAGAFDLAAGNLCRQTVEQVLLIICHFSSMPRHRYLRFDGTLRTSGELLRALDRHVEPSRTTHWVTAAQCGSRIHKLVRVRRTIAKWARILNEPSHFSIRARRTDANSLRKFIGVAQSWFDEKDKNVLVAIVNDVLSKGRFVAALGPEPLNIPQIRTRVVVRATDIGRNTDGKLTMTSAVPHAIISKRIPVRGRWPRVPVFLESTGDIAIGVEWINRHGNHIDVRDLRNVIAALSTTEQDRFALSRRLKRLGITLHYELADTPPVSVP